LTDDELLRAFESREVPADGFHHAQHVRVAWCYLRRHPLPDALGRFRDGLRAFAAAQGSPERYHETITTAYVLLIAAALDEGGRPMSWDEFAAAYPDLLSWTPSILTRYYTETTLWSPEARRTFVAPDLPGAGPLILIADSPLARR